MSRQHGLFHQLKQTRLLLKTTASIAVLLFAASSNVLAAAQGANTTRAQDFTAAAREFNVPVSILLAVSYNQTHWENSASASVDGGYGVMDLRTYTPATVSGRDGSKVAPINKQLAAYYTLDQAANLLHVSAATLKSSDQQNIRGGAAVLAQDAKTLNGGTVPTSVNDWYGALAAYSGAATTTAAASFADDVYGVLKQGASTITSDDQSLSLPATATVAPNTAGLSAVGQITPMTVTPPTGQTPECPSSLNCRFVPAAYAQDDPNDPANYGNYDPANRPKDMAIKYIFIHDTEGSYDSAINHFQDPTAYDSAQYVVRSSDGAVTQMVRNQDVSWGVYDWYDNMHGINIENEGFAAQGSSWYTPAMYQSDASLVRYLAAKYNIPLDRQHILGHDNISVLQAVNFPNQHWDPGPYWNWLYFMALVQGKSPSEATAETESVPATSSTAVKKGDVATIAPHFSTNQPPVTDCQTGTCVTLPAQGTSFVYLYGKPSTSASLLSDKNLHTDGSAGTTEDSDWGDKAPAGFQYVVAGVQGNWTQIYFAGTTGWFYNPAGSGRTAIKSASLTISPKNGKSVLVYGAAAPEASAYPSDIPVEQTTPLYTIPAGQSYTTTGQQLPADYYYDATINYSLPDDHAIVIGNTKYYQIAINHRIGYVKASDVTLHS